MTEVITQLRIPKEDLQWTPYEKRPYPAAFPTDQQAAGGGHTIAEWWGFLRDHDVTIK